MKTVKKSDFIKGFPFFKDAPDSLLFELLAYGRPVFFEEGRRLFRESDACGAVGFFLSGGVRVYKCGPTGREVTLYTVGRGDICILNAACVLSNAGYPANATVTENSEALVVPAAHFRGLMNRHERMRAYVFSLLGQRLFAMIELVEEVLFRKMDERLEEYLREHAREKAARVTHQNIANDLGTSREVVSRLLKELERNGKIASGRNRIRYLS